MTYNKHNDPKKKLPSVDRNTLIADLHTIKSKHVIDINVAEKILQSQIARKISPSFTSFSHAIFKAKKNITARMASIKSPINPPII